MDIIISSTQLTNENDKRTNEPAAPLTTSHKQSYSPPQIDFVPFSTEERVHGCLISARTAKLYDC